MTRVSTASLRALWTLDPTVRFLNHGSFGATPRAVLDVQGALRERIEREPVRFLGRELGAELDAAIEALARFVGAAPEDLVAVTNATSGVNAVLRSLPFEPGDELLTTNQGYNACSNALRFVAHRARAKVVVAAVPFPLSSADEIVQAILEKVTDHTRIALIDHVTSPTALVYPVQRLARALRERGIQVLVDGAHAPGMLPLDMAALEADGVDFYTGNCHKWMCAPKGAAFLWVRRALQGRIHPTVISHGANASTRARSRFRLEFDWVGTDDPTAFLCVPSAIECLAASCAGGWDAIRAHNHGLVLQGRRILCERLGLEALAPSEMIGSIASVRIRNGPALEQVDPFYVDPLQRELFDEEHIEVPIFSWPAPPQRLLRISAQIYNTPDDFVALAGALEKRL